MREVSVKNNTSGENKKKNIKEVTFSVLLLFYVTLTLNDVDVS